MRLRAENLQKTYRNRRVVNDVSLEVNQGEIIGLLGPNGAGKTTSFYMIVGLVQANGGQVFIDDMNITHFPMYKDSPLHSYKSQVRTSGRAFRRCGSNSGGGHTDYCVAS